MDPSGPRPKLLRISMRAVKIFPIRHFGMLSKPFMSTSYKNHKAVICLLVNNRIAGNDYETCDIFNFHFASVCNDVGGNDCFQIDVSIDNINYDIPSHSSVTKIKEHVITHDCPRFKLSRYPQMMFIKNWVPLMNEVLWPWFGTNKVIKTRRGCISPAYYHIGHHVFSTMPVSELFEKWRTISSSQERWCGFAFKHVGPLTEFYSS